MAGSPGELTHRGKDIRRASQSLCTEHLQQIVAVEGDEGMRRVLEAHPVLSAAQLRRITLSGTLTTTLRMVASTCMVCFPLALSPAVSSSAACNAKNSAQCIDALCRNAGMHARAPGGRCSGQ